MAAGSARTRSPARELRRHSALIAAVVLVGLAWLLAASVAYGWHPVTRPDHQVLHRLHHYAVQHPGQTSAWRWITSIGQPWCWRGAALAAAVPLVVRRRVRAAAYLTLLAVLTVVVSTVVKDLVDRRRPSWDLAVLHLGGPSFPSGHALTSVTLAAGGVAVLRAVGVRRAVVIGAAIVLGGFAVLVGFSRLVLGVHYLSDVVGGWLMAGAIVCAFLPVLNADGDG